MITSRLYREILLPFAVFACVVALGVVGLGGATYQRLLEKSDTERLTAIAQTIATRGEFFRTPVDRWEIDLKRLAMATGVHVTVVSGDGTPLADSHGEAFLRENLASRPEFRSAARTGLGVEPHQGTENASVVVAVSDLGPGPTSVKSGPKERHLRGFIRVESMASSIEADLARWRLYSACFAAAATLVGLVLSVHIASRLAGPVEALTSAAKAFTGENPSLPQLSPGKSLAPLSSALSDMTSSLNRQLSDLRSQSAYLQTTSERLSSVLSGMSEGVLAVGRDERVLFANPAAATLLDVPGSSLIGRPLWEAVRLPAIQQTALAALRGGEIPRTEIELSRSQITLALRVSYLPGDPNPGIVIVLHDITELKRLENLRREFVSNVSHELKTPLASIQAYTETLLEGAINDADHNRRFLHRIAEQAERLHSLILDLLRLARIESGTDVFEIRKLTLGKIIQSCVEEHLAVATSRKLQLVTQAPDEVVRLNADPDGLRTVIDNLLDNAINYTPPGGRVSIGWHQVDGFAIIEVSDTGIGIPPEHQARIFERFHRVDQARSRDRGGTGLGLAIVKHLVQVFNGQVEVESELGKGSTFRVRLPAA